MTSYMKCFWVFINLLWSLFVSLKMYTVQCFFFSKIILLYIVRWYKINIPVSRIFETFFLCNFVLNGIFTTQHSYHFNYNVTWISEIHKSKIFITLIRKFIKWVRKRMKCHIKNNFISRWKLEEHKSIVEFVLVFNSFYKLK